MATPPDIVVYSKPECHLCDDLKQQLHRLQQTTAFEWREVNILDDPVVFREFRYDVPVVFINNKKVSKFYFDEKRFLRELKDSQ